MYQRGSGTLVSIIVLKMQFILQGPDRWTGFEKVTCIIPDISKYFNTNFYDLMWWYPAKHLSVSEHHREQERCVGVSHHIVMLLDCFNT